MATPIIGRFSELDFVVNQPLPDNLFVNISNNPAQAYLDGKLEGFYSSFENGKFYIRGTPIATQQDGRLTIIAVDREDETNIVTRDVVFNVRNPAPVVEALDPVRIVRGVQQDIFIPIANSPGTVEVFGLLTGLKHEGIDDGVRVTGVVPVNAEFSKEADTIRIVAETDGGIATGTLDFTLATATLPLQVTGLTASLVTGTTDVMLAWTAPSDGGTPILRYEVSINGGDWISTESTTPSYRARGLMPRAAAHTFQVRAVNGLGAGPASREVRIVNGRAPTIPSSIVAIGGDEGVWVIWDHPRDRGLPQATYEVWRSSGIVAPLTWTRIARGITGTTYIDLFTATGSRNYRVRAVNPVGSSGYTALATSGDVPGRSFSVWRLASNDFFGISNNVVSFHYLRTGAGTLNIDLNRIFLGYIPTTTFTIQGVNTFGGATGSAQLINNVVRITYSGVRAFQGVQVSVLIRAVGAFGTSEARLNIDGS